MEFVEPFAGGAAVGLAVANERLAIHVTLVEIDGAVASVWRVVVNGEDDVDVLVERIKNFEVTEQSVEAELSKSPQTLNDFAFQTIVRNRSSRGGLLAPGSGLLKKGENGKGLLSRWYPETLGKRIVRLVELRPRINFIQGDGLQTIEELAACADNVFFIDPPYTISNNGAGKRLYTCSALDHEALFRLAATIAGDFLMTYDNHPEVRSLAVRHNFDVEEIKMRNAHHSLKVELLIGKNLTWMRDGDKEDLSRSGIES
jgi:DNA adenine methylase